MKTPKIAKTIFSCIFISSMISAAHGQTKIMPLGDSITRGITGSSPIGGYRDDLAVLLTNALISFDFVGSENDGVGFDADHQGVNGLRADEMVTLIDGWLTLNVPDIVILNIGTNDIAADRNGSDIITDIGTIIDKIVAVNSSVKIILSTLVPRTDLKDGDVTALNAAIENLVSQKAAGGIQIVLADPNAVFKANPNWKTDHMNTDGVHPNNSGYAILAQIYFDGINFDPNSDLVHIEEFDDAGTFAQDWTVGQEYTISNGELVNTNVAPNTGWSLAVFNKLNNPVEVTMVYASSATSEGIRQSGLALRLSADNVNANGYLIRYNSTNNSFELFELLSGTPGNFLDSRNAGALAVSAGDTFEVELSSDGSGHHFDIFVNNQTVGSVSDAFKNQGNEGTLYSGVVLKGDQSNNVDRFTYRRPSDLVPPGAINNLQVINITGSSASLQWTAPAEDGSDGGPAQSYDIRYFTSPINEANFLFATQASNTPVPAFPGVTQNFSIGGLAGSTTYYFAIKSRDEVGNFSPISNVPSSTTSELGCTVDDFGRATLGPDWTAGSEIVITNGQLENTAIDDAWEHLAVYSAIKNATEVSVQYSQTSDENGRGGTGLGLLLDANSTTADGYMCYIKSDNTLRLWNVTGGSPTFEIVFTTSAQPITAAGGVFGVITSNDAAGNHFEFFVNGVSAGRLTDPNKLQGTGATLYSGVFLRGNRNNNIDNFTLCSEPGSPAFFSKVSGDNQTGTINAPLAQPIVGKVTDTNGNPVPGIGVDFAVISGGGSVEPLIDQNNIFVEAESGNIQAPMQTAADAGASGGLYVVSPNGSGPNGSVTLSFNVPTSGSYKIWGHCRAPSGVDDKFSVTVNGGSQLVWDIFQGISTSGWKWDEVSHRGSGGGATPEVDPVIFQLNAGLNAVVIGTLDDGSQLDKILVTNNLNFVPVGTSEDNTPTTDDKGEAKAVWTLGPTVGTNNNQVQASVPGQPGLGMVTFTASATPDTADVISLESGNNQVGSASQPLAEPFKVLVLGKLGTPVANHDVTFSVTSGGGNFSGSSQVTVQTDASGIAQATLTLGPQTGASNTAQASASFQGTPLTGSPVNFTANSGVPDKLEAVSNTSLSGTVNLPLADSVQVRVRDSIGNPLAGFPVDFEVITTGGFEQGKVNGGTTPVTVNTNASGIAKVQWSLGPAAGSDNNKLRASASVPTGSPIEFLASAQVGSADKFLEISGDEQTGLVQTNLDSPFVVKITDASDNPVAGWPVKFKVVAGGGKFSGQDSTSATTNASGEASVTLTLGSEAGTPQNPFNNVVEASAENNNQPLAGSPVTFKASAVATGASHLEVVGGDNQTGPAAEALPQAISVKVTDGPPASNPIANHSVRFRITGGGGTINDLTTTDTTITTNSSGIVSVDWYMGGNLTANAQKLEVTATDGINNLNGSPKVFQATATAGAVDPSASFLTANPDTLSADGVAKTTITVTLTDKFGNRIPGKAITLNSSGNNNIFEQPQVPTNGNGQVTGRLSSTSAEVKTVSARIIGGISLSAFTNVVFTPLNPDKVVTNSGDGQTGNIGTALDNPVEVQVTDINNNIVPDVDVTFAVSGGGGHLIDEASTSEGQSITVKTDNQGIAKAMWVLGPNPGNNTANATVTYQGNALTGSPRNFNATGVNATATTLVLFDGDNQTGGAAGGTLPKPLQVKVTDANGKPVFNVPLDFEIQLGGGMLANESPVTNYKGIAETKFTLGPIVGTNIVQASNSTLSGSPIVFTFQSVVGPPAILKGVSGNGGSAVVNSLYPIAAKIMDINKNPIQGAHANFEVVQGGASIEGSQNVQTDADGIAQAQVRLPTAVDTVMVKVTSNDLPGFFDTFTIDAEAAAAANLVEAGGNNQEGTIGRELVFPFQVLVTDPFGNPVSGYTINWVRTVGNGSPSNTSSTTNSEGIASLNYTIANQVGTNEVRAVAALNPGQMTFTATGVTNNFPLFTGLTNKSVVEGNLLQFAVSATDDDSDPITYEAQNLPTGATFDANTATFSWTPPLGSYGDFDVTFVVRDNRGGLDSETITISVQNSNNPPVVNSHNPSEFTVQFNFGDIITFNVNVVDPDNDDIDYMWLLFTDLNSNGTLVSTSPDFEFITSNFNPGTFIIRVEITDGWDTKILEWRLDLVTSVDLASFLASFAGFEGAEIAWTTSRESDNLGFDVLRSRSENGTYKKLNDDLISSSSEGEYKFVDSNVDVGVRYYYILEDVNVNGARTQHGPIFLDITAPETFELSQNYPNPFNPTTKIRYQLPSAGNVEIKIFDVLGRRVKVLLDDTKEAGFHEITWDARNDAGRKVSTGIYYYQIIASDFKETKKMILMK